MYVPEASTTFKVESTEKEGYEKGEVGKIFELSVSKFSGIIKVYMKSAVKRGINFWN